jgi:tetratricopeptide (TPR) repeat protein
MVMIASRRNPYIIGRPVHEAELFFDREELFTELRDALAQQAQVILLSGQRRIGKSSFLTQIPKVLADEPYCFVSLSLEGKSQKSLEEVLWELARDIKDSLELTIDLPSLAAIAAKPALFADQFLVDVYWAVVTAQGDCRLVLLLDEFDTLSNYHPEAAATHLFPYLSGVIQRHQFLHIIPVIGRRVDDLTTMLGLFRGAPRLNIGRLNERDTKALITQPTADVLFYEDDAVRRIYELTAGHPYFTQVLCFAIFSQAREDDWWQVTADSIDERLVDRALELGAGGIAWFWDGLPIPERVVFSAAAAVAEQKIEECRTQQACSDMEIRKGDPLILLEEMGISLTDCLHKAEDNLLTWEYLRRLRRTSQLGQTVLRDQYQITIELVRRWLMQSHNIRQEIFELQDLNPEVRFDYEQAREYRQRGQIQPAIIHYETVYKANPNHIGTIFELAECLLSTKAYDRAVKLYERVYQIDPLRGREGLIQSRLGRAKLLLDRDELAQATTDIARVLEIEPHNETAHSLQTTIIDRRLDRTNNRGTRSWGRFISSFQWNLLGRNPAPEPLDDDNPPNSEKP